jgi:hypothetical protein
MAGLVLSRMPAATPSLAAIPSVFGEHHSAVISWPIAVERRSRVRYLVELSVRFRAVSQTSPFVGAGRVVNASRGGVWVVSQDKIRLGAQVEMTLEWPFLLDGQIPLQLFATGRILRREASGFAATIDRYEFRTRKIST